jgi:hypothetical protein
MTDSDIVLSLFSLGLRSQYCRAETVAAARCDYAAVGDVEVRCLGVGLQ